MTKLGAACLHSKIRLSSGHLGLIGVAVHGYKVGRHAVEVHVFSDTTADGALGSFTHVSERAFHVDIVGAFLSTVDSVQERMPLDIPHERHEVTGRPIGITLGVGACDLVKRAWVGIYRVGGANALCASLAPCRAVAGKSYTAKA